MAVEGLISPGEATLGKSTFGRNDHNSGWSSENNCYIEVNDSVFNSYVIWINNFDQLTNTLMMLDPLFKNS